MNLYDNPWFCLVVGLMTLGIACTDLSIEAAIFSIGALSLAVLRFAEKRVK